MRFILGISAALALTFAASAAQAGCDDYVVDEAKIISDNTKVTSAAQKLSQVGADVRVRIVSSLHGAANLDKLERLMERECPSWQGGGGKTKSTMLILMYSPAAHDAGVFYGVQHKAKLDPVWVSIQNGALVPAITAYKNGEKDAYTRAYVSMLEGFGGVLGTPANAGGKVTIVNNEAGDSSWFGKTLIGLALIGGLVFGGIFLYRRKDDRDASLGVAEETKRIRSDCRNRMTALDEDKLLLEARVQKAAGHPHLGDLQQLLATYQTAVAKAFAEFRRFDDPSREPERAANTPVKVLRELQRRYADITAQFLEPAEAARDKIDQLLGSRAAAA